MKAKENKVTIYDVAKLAGVSTATVSRVINSSNPNIRATTRKRVNDAIEKLGFIPNPSAVSLKTKRSNIISLIYSTTLDTFNTTYQAELSMAINNACHETPYDLIVYLPGKNRKDLVSFLKSRFVDGALIEGGERNAKYLENVVEAGIPYLVLGRSTEGNNYSYLDMDNYGGARLAMDHLLSLGHKNIAFIHDEPNYTANFLRFKAYRDALNEYGIKYREDYVTETEESIYAAANAVTKLMKRKKPPTAIFAGNDIRAIGAMRAVQELGYAIPKDVSIVGFDDIEMCRLVRPPLTTIRIDKQALANKAIELLQKLIETQVYDPIQEVVPVELVIRESTAPAPRND